MFRVFVASVVASTTPIVVATVRALHRKWIPVGDNAFFKIRALDVFGHHIPLLGTWTSSSISVGTNVNNPGPLLFDWLAVPTRLLGGGPGVAVAIGLLNALAVFGIAVFTYRRGGPLLGTVAMAITAALAWAMGSELLYDPWQPHALLLPFLLFLVLVWSTACGDLLALPLAAGVGSLVLQTYLTYAVLVPALSLWAIIGLLLLLRRERRTDPRAWPVLRRRSIQAGVLAVVVFVLAWAQPFIEQFTSSGAGNLTLLAREARNQHASTVGYRVGAEFIASVVSLPPWWSRPSIQQTFFPLTGWRAPSFALAAISLGALVAVLAGCAWVAHRRSDRTSSRAVVTAGVALLAGLVTAGHVAPHPVAVFAIFVPHTLRALWPLGAFVFFVVVATVARNYRPRAVSPVALTIVFATAALTFAVLNIPTGPPDGRTSVDFAIPAQRQLDQHMGGVEHRGALLIDDLFKQPFGDPYGTAVLAELQRRGVSFVASDSAVVGQLGPSRRFTGRNAQAALLLRTGEATRTAPAGTRRVATGEGLGAADQREFARLRNQVAGYLGQTGIHLNRRGRDALRRGDLPNLGRQGSGPGLDPGPLFASGELLTMIDDGYFGVDGAWALRLDRYARLQHRWDQETVALFIGPIGSEAKPLRQSLPK